LGGKMNLKIGDIVRVVGEGRCLRHWDRQGQVVGFNLDNKERPLKLWFGRECDYLLEPEQRWTLTSICAVTAPTEEEYANDSRTHARVYDYAENELQKETEWSVKTLVDRHFDNMCNRYYESKKPFVAGVNECSAEGCHRLATQRIIYNFLGTVCFADVCDKDTKLHLKCTEEGFPHKKALKAH